MPLTDLFWLIFIISMLQPVFKQKLLDSARERMIQRLEGKRKSRVVLLVHRQETMAFLGFPVLRYIDIDDSEQVVRALRMTDDSIPLDIILHTPGGLELAALQIANAVRHRKGKVTVIVPHFAMSGGTLIALAADEILLDKHAVLGPVDPQLGQMPAASILRVLREKSKDEIDDQTFMMADVAEKALHQTQAAVETLLSKRLEPARAKEVAARLTQGRWTHDYPITCEEASSMGLPVRCDVPAEVYQLMSLFPQPMRQRSSVHYIPEAYRESPVAATPASRARRKGQAAPG